MQEAIIEGTLEPVGYAFGKGRRMPYPVCHIIPSGGAYICMLNAAARRALNLDQNYCWYTYKEGTYIVAVPSKSFNAYKIFRHHAKTYGISFPTILVETGTVKPGHYKLLSHKSGGFAFEPYKRLEN